jgi:hypothetical protein
MPILLGGGASFVDTLAGAAIVLDDPRVIKGCGVTHLVYLLRGRA